MMLQQDRPDDYVVGTGEAHAVGDFVEGAFTYAGLEWQEYVEVDPRYFRPTEVDLLMADATKARKNLGWEPKVNFKELIAIMVDADMEAVGLPPIGTGRRVLEAKFSGWHQWLPAVTSVIDNSREGFE